MTWIFVNFFSNRDVETFDVNETEYKKTNKYNWTMFFLKSLSLVTYVPTGVQLLSYLLKKKNEYA